eukprot:TRINITY_DN15796_c0_g1_i1.p1 TRINITY_DN15796_c0_g1~~TRINITY_DN15796_c0_g1_i1.p1  ORF type:complete len:334 (-),score=45.10 TRINITY_DN15796_c0_g1_i1:124-1125(-)
MAHSSDGLEMEELLPHASVINSTFSRSCALASSLFLLCLGAAYTALQPSPQSNVFFSAVIGFSKDSKAKGDLGFQAMGAGTCCHFDKTDKTFDAKHTADVIHVSMDACRQQCANAKFCHAFEFCDGGNCSSRCELHHKPVRSLTCIPEVQWHVQDFECFIKMEEEHVTWTSTTTTTTVAPTTAAPTTTTTAPTTAAPTTAAPTTAAPTGLKCYQCGVGDAEGCNQSERLSIFKNEVEPTVCPAGKDFGCMAQVYKSPTTGATRHRKYCVDKATCHKQWFEETSDFAWCGPPLSSIAADANEDFKDPGCRYCCLGEGCNKAIPPKHLLYKPDGS